MPENKLANQSIQKLKNMQIVTLTVTATGSLSSGTAYIYNTSNIVVEATTVNDNKTLTMTTPIAFEVTGMRVLATATTTGAMTVQLYNNITAITDAVDIGAVANTYIADAATIDDAQSGFAVGDDDLKLSFTADPASTPSTNSVRVIIYIHPTE